MLESLDRRVIVEPDRTAERIREYARQNPDLRHDRYDGRDGTVDGMCYPIAEAYWHAKGGTDSGMLIYCLSWSDVDPSYGGTHWYLRDSPDGPWVDLGAEERSDAVGVPYAQGRGPRAFMTGYERPSKRAKRILADLDLIENTE